MTFRSRELSVLAYANGFTLWHYRTEDDAATVLASVTGVEEIGGYFDSACELLRTGDRIMVSLSQGNRAAMLDLVVTAAGPAFGVAVAATGASRTESPPVIPGVADRPGARPVRETVAS